MTGQDRTGRDGDKVRDKVEIASRERRGAGWNRKR